MNDKMQEGETISPKFLKYLRNNFNMKINGWTPNRGEVGEINPFYTDKQLINKYYDKSRNRRKK